MLKLLKRKKTEEDALHPDYFYEMSSEKEVYIVRLNQDSWFKEVEGITSFTLDPNDADDFDHLNEALDIARYFGGKVIKKVTLIYFTESYEP